MAFIKTHQRSNTVFGVLRSDNDGIGKTIPLVQALIPYRYRLPEIVELGRRMDLRDADATNITVDKKNKVVTGVKKVTFETKALLRIIDDTEGTGIDLVVPLKKTTLSFWRIRALETAPFKTGKEPLIHFEAYRDSINQRITPEQVASLRRPVRDEESVHAPSNTAPAQPVPAAPYENQAATVEGVVSTNTATLSAASNQPIISSEDRGTSTEEVDIPFSQEPVTTVEEGIYCTLGQATLPTATNQAIFSPTNLTGQVATIEGVEGTISKYITTLVEELGSSLVEATGPIFTSQLALPTEVAEDDTLEAQVAILEQVQSSPLQVVITTVEQVDSSTLQTLLTTENQVDLPAITQVTTTITSKPSDIPSPVIENQALLAHSEPNHPSNQGFKACPVGHSSSYSFDEEDLLVDDLAQTVKHPPTTAQLPVDLTLDYHSTNELSFLQALAYPSIEALTGETAIAQVSEGTLRNITQPPEDSLTEKVPPLAQTRRSQSLRKFVGNFFRSSTESLSKKGKFFQNFTKWSPERVSARTGVNKTSRIKSVCITSHIPYPSNKMQSNISSLPTETTHTPSISPRKSLMNFLQTLSPRHASKPTDQLSSQDVRKSSSMTSNSRAGKIHSTWGKFKRLSTRKLKSTPHESS
jgi:hypothetical protein